MKTVISVTTDRQKGGIANALISLSRALKLAGYRHIVLLPEAATILPELEKQRDVQVLCLPLFWLKFHLFTRFFFCPPIRAEIDKASALLVHNASLIKPVSRWRRPHFFISHSGKLRHLEKAEHILFLTRSAQRRAEEYFARLGLTPDSQPAKSILPHGFNLPAGKADGKTGKKTANHPVKIITAGRFVAKKGFADLIDAAAILQQKNIPCEIEIYGTGQLESALASRISAAHLGNISVKGWAEDLSAIFAEADIFCLPSHEEPFGLILGEAMLAGLPVIATRTDGPVDILGQNGERPDATLAFGGVLAEAENPAALAEAIEEMVKNPDRRKKAGLAGQHHIHTNYSLKKQAERLKAILTSAQR